LVLARTKAAACFGEIRTGTPTSLPAIAVTSQWQDIFSGPARARLETLLPEYLKSRPWFSHAAKNVKQVTLKDVFKMPLPDDTAAALAFLQVEYFDANAELLALPLAFAPGMPRQSDSSRRSTAKTEAAAGAATGPFRENAIAALTLPEDAQFGIVYDAFANPAFAPALLGLIGSRERLRNERGELEAVRLPARGNFEMARRD